jgi:hypothetical protein
MEGSSSSYCYSSDSLSMFLIVPSLSLCFPSISKSSFLFLFTYHSSFHVCYFKLSSLLFSFFGLIYCVPYFSALFRFMSFLSVLVLTFSLQLLVLCYFFSFPYIWFYYVCGFIVYIWFYSCLIM